MGLLASHPTVAYHNLVCPSSLANCRIDDPSPFARSRLGVNRHTCSRSVALAAALALGLPIALALPIAIALALALALTIILTLGSNEISCPGMFPCEGLLCSCYGQDPIPKHAPFLGSYP